MILDKLENMLRKVVREELERALVRDITVETKRSNPDNPKIEVKRMSVLDYILVCSNHTEGALRGMQSDVGKSYNLISELGSQTYETFKAICNAINDNKKIVSDNSNVKRISRNS